MKYHENSVVCIYLIIIQSSLVFNQFVRRWAIETKSSLGYNSSAAIKQRQDILNSVCEEYLDVLNPETSITHYNVSVRRNICIPPLFIGKQGKQKDTIQFLSKNKFSNSEFEF